MPAEGKTARPRDLGLDLVRCAAVLGVVSVHFFLYSGFYDFTVAGERILISIWLRTASMTCVPLFLMLTGYLMCHKQLSRSYYSGVGRVLGTYLLVSICCYADQCRLGNAEPSLGDFVLRVSDFKAAGYSWYIEMYLGLFLLIPFLNLIWNGLETPRRQKALLITMLLTTTIPLLVNVWDWTTPGAWLHPAEVGHPNQLLPNYWECLYPITYYFLGAYLRVWDWKLSQKKTLALLLTSITLFTCYNYYRTAGGEYPKGGEMEWNALQNVIHSVLLFQLLHRTDLSRCPKWCAWLLTRISLLSLTIYLISEIFDRHFYGLLTDAVPKVLDRVRYYPLLVPLIFLCATVSAQLLEWFRQLLAKVLRKLRVRKL